MDRRIKPLMLKDFLVQDFSSCSSNGFISFPRRQCCSSGPLFLLDNKDHSINNFNKKPNMRKSASSSKPFHQKSRSSKPASSSSSKISAFQAVLNAVKNLPFSSSYAVKSPSLQNRKKNFCLPRSLSRKLFRKSFWKKGEVVVREKCKPLSVDYATVVKTAGSTETTTVSGGGTSNSENWSDDSECTSANSASFSCESSSFVGKDPIFEGYKKELLNEKLSNSDPTPTTKPTCFIEDKSEKQGRIDEDKEQCSPVSILDCPFEEETCSPFQSRHTRFKPLNLQKRLALSAFGGDKTSNASEQSSQAPEKDEDAAEAEQEGKEFSIEQEAKNLLKLITSSNLMFKVDDVLILDFFMKKLEGRQVKMVKGEEKSNKKLMKEAEDYISGNQNRVILDWKVEKSRKEYVKQMEEEDGTCWKKFDGEKQEVIGEVEVGIWNTLVDELLLDFV